MSVFTFIHWSKSHGICGSPNQHLSICKNGKNFKLQLIIMPIDKNDHFQLTIPNGSDVYTAQKENSNSSSHEFIAHEKLFPNSHIKFISPRIYMCSEGMK